jgi:hypothetical protein
MTLTPFVHVSFSFGTAQDSARIGDGIFENVIDIVCPSPPHKLLLE